MSKTLIQRQQDEIEELRHQLAEVNALLRHVAQPTTQSAISENVQLRLQNDDLRRQLSFFSAIIPPEIQKERPKLLSPHSGERTAEFTDWGTAIAVGCTIFIRHTQEDITVVGLDGCLYPGSTDEFIEVIPRQIAMLLSRIPTPADLRSALPPGIDGEKQGYILRSLTYARRQSEEHYRARRKELFDECWPDIDRAYDDELPDQARDREAARRDFYQFCDRSMDYWDKYMKENVSVYRHWDNGNGSSQNLRGT